MMAKGFEQNGNCVMGVKQVEDWCHLCGNRSKPLVEAWYPKNAEQGGDTTEYIRICEWCVLHFQKVLNCA